MPDPINDFPLHKAVRDGNYTLLQDLLLTIPRDQRSIELNKENLDGKTPLMMLSLANDNCIQILQLLLLNGADIDYVSSKSISTYENLRLGVYKQLDKSTLEQTAKIILKHLQAEGKIATYKKNYQDIPTAFNANSKGDLQPGLFILLSYLNKSIADIDQAFDPDIMLAALRSAVIIWDDNHKLMRDYKRFALEALIDKFDETKIIDEILSYNNKRRINGEDKDGYQIAYDSILDMLTNLESQALEKLKKILIENKDTYISNDEYRDSYISLLLHLGMTVQIKEILDHNNAEALAYMQISYCKTADDGPYKGRLIFNNELSTVYFLSSLVNFESWDMVIINLSELIKCQINNPNQTFEIQLILLLSKIENKLLFAEAEQKVDSSIIEQVQEELYRIFAHIEPQNTLKDKLATTIINLSLIKSLEYHTDVDAYVLANPFLLASIISVPKIDKIQQTLLAERLIALFDNPSHINESDNFKQNLFSTLLKHNPEIFFNLFTDDSKYHSAQCNFISENFGAILRQYKIDDDYLYAKMKEYLTKKHEKIPYSNIIPYIQSGKMLQKILDYNLAPLPNKTLLTIPRNNANTNPILLAASNENFVLFTHMFNNRENEPWKTYWEQAGDPENTLLKFLLKMPVPGSSIYPDIAKKMLLYAAQIKSVVKHMDYAKLDEFVGELLITLRIAEGANHDLIWTIINNIDSNRRLLDVKFIYPYESEIESRSSIKQWWARYLKMQQILNAESKKSQALAVPLSSKNAHNVEVAAAASKIHNKDFVALLARRYPECGNQKEREHKALIDARLLLLKSFIECKPTDAPSIEVWEQIVKMSGMSDYYQTYSIQSQETGNLGLDQLKTRSFANFKRIAIENEQLMQRIIDPPNNADSDLSIYFAETQKTVNSTYLQRCSFEWNPYSPVIRQSPTKNPIYYALETSASAKQFTLFTMLLATEDVTAAIENIAQDDYSTLYEFVSHNNNKDPEYKTISTLIQRKMLELQIDVGSDMQWDEIKAIVLKHALLEHSALCASFAASANNCAIEKSCETGVICIFSSAILSQHRQYYHSGVDKRSSEIQKFMATKFETALDEKIISILLRRLKPKQTKFNFFSYKPKKNDRVVNNAIDNIIASSPKTFEELLIIIKDIKDHSAKQEIINLLFPSIKSIAALENETDIIENDKELSVLFDAFFTVNTNNFSDLFSGSRSIIKYTGHLKSELTPHDTISLDKFDSITGRAKFLRTCFDLKSLPNEISRALKHDDARFSGLSEYDISVIKYYSVAIAEAARLDGIRSTLLKNLGEIHNLKIQKDTNVINNIPKNTNISDCEQNISGFFASLQSQSQASTIQNSVAKTSYELQLKDNLYKAVGAEYSLTLLRDNPEFVLSMDQFDNQLEEDHNIDLMTNCKTLIKYLNLPENLAIKKIRGFRTLDEFITEVAHYAQRDNHRDNNTDVYEACQNISKAINLRSFYINNRSWDAWETKWNKNIEGKKADFDLL